MVEFFQQYGSYISALVVIIFQIVKMLINNKKMNNKFSEISGQGKIDKNKKDNRLLVLSDAIAAAEKCKKELLDKIDCLKSQLVEETKKVGKDD